MIFLIRHLLVRMDSPSYCEQASIIYINYNREAYSGVFK